MFTKLASKPQRAFTLVEMMVAGTILSIVITAIMSLFVFSIRSYAAVSNYALLDQVNRQAMDKLTFEIRQAVRVVDYTTNSTGNSLTIVTGDGTTVTYQFQNAAKQVMRFASDGSSTVLLTNCSLLNFNLYMRPPTNGTFDVYPVNMGTNWQQTVKVVQLSWKTAMTVAPTARVTSEDIQTARIIIRKQQNDL